MSDRSESLRHTNPAKQKTGRVILIADDAPLTRAQFLTAFPADEVLQAGTEQQARALLHARTDIDLAVLGTFGASDGLALLDALRADVPVLVLTDVGDTERVRAALARGAQEVLPRPVDAALARRRAENVLTAAAARAAAEQNRAYRAELEQRERQLDSDHRDPLTGLLNRAAFAQAARHTIAQAAPNSYVLSCLDIDSFKVVNDRFGHGEGDRLLRFIAETRRAEVDPLGGYVCRDMADVFLTLLPNDEQTLRSVTQHFFEQLRQYELPMLLTAHIGRYIIDEPALDVDLMIDRAMLAMQSIKGSVEVRVAWFDEGMRRSLLREQELVDEMRPALARGQFHLYYQPQYDYSTGMMTSAEALVRWVHPEKGIISPAEFIPLFEKNGFISALDEYVWEQACRALRRWTDAGLRPVPVSVNISRRDIRNPDLPSLLAGLVQKYGLSPDQLHLEITESAYVDRPQQLIRVVRALQERGFAVEMDDFGSGYSSLNTLKDVPVDRLKLDMQFSSATEEHSRGGSILSSVVRMAHWLRLPVIAEGVETKQQADYLKSIGCFLMQGYYFAKPMPAEDFETLLSAPRKRAVRQKPDSDGVKGAAEFLDASTQATLLFNSFVGGAEIIEFDGENAEVLRTNDRFYEVLGCSPGDYAGKELDLFARFYPESRETLRSALREAIRTGEEVPCELHSYSIKPGSADFWTRNRIRFLSRNVRRYILYNSVENITESKELESTRERLDRIVRNMPAGVAIYEFDRENVSALYVSDRAVTILGFTPAQYEEHRQAGDLSPFCPDAETLSRARAAREGDAPIDVTIPVRQPDGSWIWMRVVASVVRPHGSMPLIYAALLDVTAQHESEEELRALLHSLPGGVIKYSADAEGRILFVSDGLLQLLGYTRAEFRAKFHDRFPLLICAEDRARVLEEIDAQIAGNGSQDHCEYRIETGDGRLKWFFDVGRLVREADGSASFYVIIIDADERKQLEIRLAEESKRSEALVANVPGGVITLAVRRGNVTCDYFSDGVCRMLGYSREEMRALFDEGVSSFIHPEDRGRVIRASERSAREYRTFNEEYRLRNKNGGYIWVNLTGNPVLGRDGVLRFYCAYTNVTEFMLSEQRLRVEKKKTEQAMQFANVSIWEYDVAAGALIKLGAGGDEFHPPRITDVPASLPSLPFVDPATADAYVALHRAVANGAEQASENVLLRPGPDQPSVWYRVHYRTVFAGGVPVSAIGSAVNIAAEAESVLQMKEMALAMDAASLYFWSYAPDDRTFLAKNRNATQLTDARFTYDELAAVLERGPLLPEERERVIAFARARHDGSATASDILLRLNGQYHGLEWLRLSCASVQDGAGRVTAYVVVGEDVTARVRSERLYAEAIRNLDSLDDVTVAARVQANLTRDEIELHRSTIATASDSYSQSFARLLDRIPNEGQRRLVTDTFGRDALLRSFANGQNTVSARYQIQIRADLRPLWMSLTATLYRDPQSGDVKTFQYVRNIDDELAQVAISRTVSLNSFELLGLIYLQNAWMHCYAASALEERMGIDTDANYADRVGAFIESYVPERARAQAREALSLDTVVRRLGADDQYTVVLPIVDGENERFKRWSFFWLDESKTTVVIARADVTESRAQRVQSEELRLALASSNTVVCRYDVARSTLTMPEEYAVLLGLSPVLAGVPEETNLAIPGDAETFRGFFARIRAGEPTGEATVQFPYFDGSRHWSHATFTAQYDDAGHPESAVITVRDVTLQRMQEIENERMRLIIEQNDIAIIDYDLRSDTLYLEVNRVNRGIIRKVIPNYYNQLKDSKYDTPDSADKLRALIRDAAGHSPRAATGTLDYQGDIWGTGYRWVRLHYSYITDDTGAVYRIVGQISDIHSERTRELLLSGLEARAARAEALPVHDPAIVSRIFQFLYDAPEFDDAIRTILRLLGESYGVSRVYVREKRADVPGRHVPPHDFEWCADGVAPRDGAQSADDDGAFNKQGFFRCDDAETQPARRRNALRRAGVRARLQYALRSDAFSGVVGLDDCAQARVWTPDQIGTLTLVSHVLCVYLARRHAQEATNLSHDFLSALDDSPAFIYVVDPNDYHILFNNRALRSRFGDHATGHICYEAAIGRQTPCEDCPIRAFRETGCSKSVEILRPDGMLMLSQASPIHWGGREMFMVTCTDVTEQRALERERAIGQALSDVVQNIPGNVYSFSAAEGCRLDYVSETLCRLVGRTRAEIAGRLRNDYALLICAEDRQVYRGAVRRLRARQKATTLEYRLEKPDGTLFWVSDTLKCVTHADGARWIYAAVSEIDRERSALIRLQALTDSVPGCVAIYDYADHRLTLRTFSDALCRITGYSRAALTEMAVHDAFILLHEEDADIVRKALGELLATGRPVECEYRINAKPGIRFLRLNACVLERGPRGTSFCAVMLDVTPQREAEARLAGERARFDRMGGLLGAGMLVCPQDFGGSPLFVSASMEIILGYSAGEIAQLYRAGFRKILHPDDARRVLEAHRQYAAERTPSFELEFRFLRKDGGSSWTHERTTLIDMPDGEPVYLSVFLECTRQHEAQERLRVQEEAYRIALAHASSLVYRYDFRRRTLYMPPDTARQYSLPSLITDAPEGVISAGLLAPESVGNFRALFDALLRGEDGTTAEVRWMLGSEQRWFRGGYNIIRGEQGVPDSAIITFTDIDDGKRKDAEISDLRRNEFLLRTVARHAQKLIALYDFASGTLTPYDERSTGIESLPFFPRPEDYLPSVAPESADSARAFLEKLRGGAENGSARLRLHVNGGLLRWYSCIFSTVTGEGEIPTYSILSVEDVTDVYEKELAYQRYQSLLTSPQSGETYFVEFDLTQDRFERASENLRSQGQLLAAKKGLISFVSYMTRRTADAQERTRLRSFLDRKRLMAAYAGGACTADLDISMRTLDDGEPVYVRASYQMISDPYTGDVRILLSCRIIDREKRAELALRSRAETDDVTGLLNRATFLERVAERMAHADRTTLHAFAMLDVDRFKAVNDTFGHVYGDVVLREVAHALRTALFREDLIGRLGGDEFGLFIGGFPDRATLNEKLELIRTTVCREIRDRVRLSASIGVALFPQDGDTFEPLYAKADAALYSVKRIERGQYAFYQDEMGDAAHGTMLSPIDAPKQP